MKKFILTFVLLASVATASQANTRFSNTFVGVSTAAVVSKWISWTPTGSWSTNSTYTGKYRRVGPNIECQVYLSLSGAPDSAALNINLPPGITLDTTNLLNSGLHLLGGGLTNAGGTQFYVKVLYNNTTNVLVYTEVASGTNLFLSTQVTQAVPGTYANGNHVTLDFSGPVVGW